MTVSYQDFVRRQFSVQAVQVTPINIAELAEACGGELKHDGDKEGNYSRDYIKVRVLLPLNEEQTKARIGDWLVKQGRTFKVYKDPAFRKAFELRGGDPVPGGPPSNGGKTHPKRKNKGKGRPQGAPQQHKPGQFVPDGPQGQKKGPSPANMPKKRTEAPDLIKENGVVHRHKSIEETAPEAAAARRHEELAGSVTANSPGDPEEVARINAEAHARGQAAVLEHLKGLSDNPQGYKEFRDSVLSGQIDVTVEMSDIMNEYDRKMPGLSDEERMLAEQKLVNDKISEEKLPLASPAPTAEPTPEELHAEAVRTGEYPADGEPVVKKPRPITLDQLNSIPEGSTPEERFQGKA